MDTPTLKQLRYFVALAETRHFGRAAAQCHVTQPALSMQIRELEAVLGAVLVERTPSGLLLTGEGEEVARRARQVLLAVRDLTDFARHGKGLAGQLRIGVIPSVGPYLLPRVLPHLHAAYPDLELSLRESQTHHLLLDLAAGKLDLVILALPVGGDEIETMPLFEDTFLLVVHPRHPLANRAEVQQSEAAGQRLLLLEEGHCLRDQALALCHAVGVDNIDDFRASSLATVVQMVMHGYGTTILPEMALPVEVGQNENVRVIRFTPPAPSRTIGLAWRSTSPRRADFFAFGRLVMEVGRGAPADSGTAALKG